MMENFIKILIYVHAFFGGLGLISGVVSVVVHKGGSTHKFWGTLFSRSMIVSSLISLVVACMPHHTNVFLFLVGVFTIYLVLAGNRALTLKASVKSKADWKDKAISYTMSLSALIMLILGLISFLNNSNLWILYTFFGAIGLFMTYRDFKTFKTFTTSPNISIVSHIGRMLGAFITSITAFMVAGLNIGNLIVWLAPTIMGIPYIIFWTRKMKTVKIML